MEKEKAKKTKPTGPANRGGGASWGTQKGLGNVPRGAGVRGLVLLVVSTVSPSSFLLGVDVLLLDP